ncbi:putative disease resistance protein (TIR-NBS-LRR class) [Trifolium medium]|uniref:Putative disease resistance protein (TIR-NBS-LRR class) n=1 Tax=Trifolium medium TaxID=97028 RepID=A0A392NC12_9FABA|nr:putative disease resistance protein (TIR-NBS-LRR class) [Trifolium medium]
MKLDQIACTAIMEEALIIIQLAAVLSSRVEYCNDPSSQTGEIYKNFDPEDSKYISRPVYIILPGNEVPDWFTFKSTDSSIITTEFSSLQLGLRKFPGFAFCLVAGPSDSNRKKICHTGFVAGCRCYVRGEYAGTCIMKSSSTDAKSNQVWLWYDQILDIVKVSRGFPLDEVSFKFFVRPVSSGLVVKQCGVRPLYAPLDTTQSSGEEEAIREGKSAYHEFEDNKTPTSYALIRQYACPRDKGLKLSLKERISGYHEGHFGKSIPSISCATNVVELEMQHNRIDNCAEVIVSFGLVAWVLASSIFQV